MITGNNLVKINGMKYDLFNEHGKEDSWLRTKDVFQAALKAADMTQVQLSHISGEPEQSIGQKINVRETVKFRDFLRLLYYLGVAVQFCTKDEEKPFLEIFSENESIDKAFDAILEKTGKDFAGAAAETGYPNASLKSKIKIRESVKSDEFLEILDVLGVETRFVVKETGEILKKERDRKGRVVGMSDGVIYDTRDSELISTSFWADHKNEYGPDGKAQDLYLDKENRYFMAEYKQGADKGRVRSVPYNVAKAFINVYGDRPLDTPV